MKQTNFGLLSVLVEEQQKQQEQQPADSANWANQALAPTEQNRGRLAVEMEERVREGEGVPLEGVRLDNLSDEAVTVDDCILLGREDHEDDHDHDRDLWNRGDREDHEDHGSHLERKRKIRNLFRTFCFEEVFEIFPRGKKKKNSGVFVFLPFFFGPRKNIFS